MVNSTRIPTSRTSQQLSALKMAGTTFELEPVSPFRLDLTVWTLRRRPDNEVDRWDGTTYRRVLPLSEGPVEVAVTQIASPDVARLKVAVTGRPVNAAVRAAVTTALERLLGLRIRLTEFYQFAAHDRHLGPLVERFRGMKPPRFLTVFEGVINAMACQLITLTLGIRLLNRLALACGTRLGEREATAHGFADAMSVAGMSPSDLRQFGFSHQKGRAMIEVAQSLIEGRLNLEELEQLPDDEAINRLRELRGVGRWTAEYVLLRGLGRTHIFPGDDVGARNNLQRWLRLTKPLDYQAVRRVLSRWDDYGGLVYFHLLLDRLREAGYLGENERAEQGRPAVESRRKHDRTKRIGNVSDTSRR